MGSHPEASKAGVDWAPAPLYPLQGTAGGEFGPTRAQVPFSLQDLTQIKRDLGKFSDPGKHRDVFQGLTQTFDLPRKDVVLL